jgi:hypothetical protein
VENVGEHYGKSCEIRYGRPYGHFAYLAREAGSADALFFGRLGFLSMARSARRSFASIQQVAVFDRQSGVPQRTENQLLDGDAALPRCIKNCSLQLRSQPQGKLDIAVCVSFR